MPNAAAGNAKEPTGEQNPLYCTSTRILLYEGAQVQCAADNWVSNVLLTTGSVPRVPQEVLLLQHLVGLAALGRAPPLPWHLEAAPAAVAQCSAGEGGRCSAVAAAAAAAALEEAVGLESDLRAPRRRLPADYRRAGAAGAAKSEAH
jgi:hypothetical protein